MHRRRILSLVLIGFLSIVIINWSCTKLDTTNLGSDLIPAVDNVNTFADTFYINATQHDYTDTTLVFSNSDVALGNINTDPLFGRTEAKLFFQLKPDVFPFAFGNADSIAGGLDSVVLCLAYKGFWGDSTMPQLLQVNELNDNAFRDSLGSGWYWPTTYEPTGIGTLVGSKQVDIRDLRNYIVYNNKRDSANNQIRIKLDLGNFANRLFASDSFGLDKPGNHIFLNDSIFRHTFNGFSVKTVSGNGNALMYVNYADTNTKLEVHYRRKNAGKIDTVYSSFKFRSTTASDSSIYRSVYANYINRSRSGSLSENPLPGELYLQGQPGTYAELKIPQLTGYTNRIVHRAEIIVEQINDPTDIFANFFVPPTFLYLDLKDSASPVKYKPIYYDLAPGQYYNPDDVTGYSVYPASGPDFSYFGGFKRAKTGPFGESMYYYNINVTRYIQRMVTDQSRNYDMRLWPAYSFKYPQYSSQYYGYNNSVALGRIRVGNGDNPNYRMRIRIVYSKIK